MIDSCVRVCARSEGVACLADRLGRRLRRGGRAGRAGRARRRRLAAAQRLLGVGARRLRRRHGADAQRAQRRQARAALPCHVIIRRTG